MARLLNKEETLKVLRAQRDSLNVQIAALEGSAVKEQPSSYSQSSPTSVVVDDISKLSPLETVFRHRPDLLGFKKELEETGLKTFAELLAFGCKLDATASLKSNSASEKATADTAAKAPTTVKPVSSTAAFRPISVKPAVPLTPLEAVFADRPDLLGFKKELEIESKKAGATKASLMALGNKLDNAAINGK